VEFFRDQGAIITFILLFMPGFVSTRVFDAVVPGQARDYGKTIYETIGYSFLTYALWSPVLIPVYASSTPPNWVTGVLALLVLFITPTALPLIYLWVLRKKLASTLIDPCPSSWDWAFQQNPTAMILVHFRDGRKIGGTWSNTAFSSSYPVPRDVFLSEVWNVDQKTGRFLTRAQDSKGLIIWGSDIEMVEFFDLDETRSKADASRQAARPRRIQA
jgi:hypothetical protein